MKWEVEYTDEFGDWWADLGESEQESVRAEVKLLEEFGPNLRFPHGSGIKGSRHGNMRELRVQHAGRPYRVLFAFDPRRCAILLLGGDKTGNDRWYLENVPMADRLYDEHLDTLRKEGLTDG
ncbi:MAG: type II toxin-antitoxin system RelE/ParE family toxin [Sulfuritalea sp.]|nr:type II toxin-antitoxin system RelE/ParE family toxin [Sulfuritalea sp.]MDP1983491.1 type II toxin-antitoxin system RelE/ParE family toxin [Sulfuritalea sp.]